jgi:hypothetical protein
MGYHQPVAWRVATQFSQEIWSFTKVPAEINVSVEVLPSGKGLAFSVDGESYSQTQAFTWGWGSVHTISAGDGNTGYIFGGWSDGGESIHQLVTGPFTRYILIYTKPESAPLPNPAAWETAPYAEGPAAVSMSAAPADGEGPFEYYFAELSGAPGGDDSSWQENPHYRDLGLEPARSFSYIVIVRRADGGEETLTAPSAPVTVRTFHDWDYDGNASADMQDLYALSTRWLEECAGPEWCDGYDIDGNGLLNLFEYGNLASKWLEKPYPTEP